MLVKRADQHQWISAGYEGAERALLRSTKEDGRTYIVRLKAGARGFQHRHAAGEDVLVLSGKIADGNIQAMYRFRCDGATSARIDKLGIRLSDQLPGLEKLKLQVATDRGRSPGSWRRQRAT